MFDNVYGVPGFCTFCKADAQYVVPSVQTADGEPLRFCGGCYTAFTMGQENPEAQAIDAADEELELICRQCGAVHMQLVQDHLNGKIVACEQCTEQVMVVRSAVEERSDGN
jgi:hypothetical protein